MRNALNRGSVRRSGRTLLLALLAVAMTATAGAAAETSYHVRLTPDRFEQALEQLEAANYDVAGHDREAATIDLVVEAAEIDGLSDFGMVTVIDRSRPFREVMEELAGGVLEDAPDNRYKTYPEVLAIMDDIEALFPAIARKIDLTNLLGVPPTWDGQHVYAMKISDNVADSEDEPAVLFDALHHARELNTIEVALDIMDHLTQSYGTPDIKALVDELEIWVVPVVNPDGLEYIWSTNDNWRKNRRNNGNGSFGVDPNRNYPFKWGICGSNSGTPSSNTYRGPAALSEPEIQTMVALGQKLRPVIYNSYHSSGREVLPPYVCGTLAEQQMVTTVRNRYRNAMNYATRPASSSGESFEWFYNQVSSVGFLTEIGTAFQPPFQQTLNEVDRVRPGWLLLLEHVAEGTFPLVEGRVTDARNGAPVEAEITSSLVNFVEGERRASVPEFGRYDWFLGANQSVLTFTADGYLPQSLTVTPAAGVTLLDVALQPEVELPLVSVVASTPAASEAGPVSGAFTVTRTGDTAAALDVSYTVSGSATPGSDYAALSGDVTIPAGAASANLAVDPIDDTAVESDEVVALALSGDAAYQVGAPGSASVTIQSDDVAQNLPVVTVSAVRNTAAEAGRKRGRIRIERTGDRSAALTVRYSVNGSATAGADYRALSGRKTIKAGKRRAFFDIVPLDDDLIEPDETVRIKLSADPAYSVGTPGAGTVTLTSDDGGPGAPVVTITVVRDTASEAGLRHGRLRIERTGNTGAALTVHYSVNGTATAGSDYRALSGRKTIKAGKRRAFFDIIPLDDAVAEPDETVVVRISADSAYQVGSSDVGRVTVTSDEQAVGLSSGAN